MEFELWMLIVFPIIFAMGWFAARIDIKYLLKESRALPLSYFKGLNFLLNEQPDKAIEAFIEVVKVEPQTLDLHFALGSLFRRQGEIERAIRMHQNLLDRPDLPADKRLAVTYELALDFYRAGLLDKAEEIFAKLQNTHYEHQALIHLLQIYEQEKDWEKAIATTKKMEHLAKQPYSREIAQYYCELAANDISLSKFDTAQRFLEQALSEHKQCVRAYLLMGDIAFNDKRFDEAVSTWRKIETQNTAFLSLTAERIADAYRKLNQLEEGIRLLRSQQHDYPSLDLLNTLFHMVLEHSGAVDAAELLKDELRRNPTLLGLDKLLEAQLLSTSAERRYELELVKGLIHQHTRRLGMYRCEQCGFRAKQYYWRCPGCSKWESYSPRRTETLEGYIS